MCATMRACVESSPPETPMTVRSIPVACSRVAKPWTCEARRCGQLWTHPGDEGQRYASLLWYRDPEHLRARQHDIGGAGVIRRCARGARWREFAGLVRHVLHPRRRGTAFVRTSTSCVVAKSLFFLTLCQFWTPRVP